MEHPLKQLFPNLFYQRSEFLLAPSQNAAEEPEREALEAIQHLRQVHLAKLLQPSLLWPDADRQLQLPDLHVAKTYVLNPSLKLTTGPWLTTGSLRRFEKGRDPPVRLQAGVECVVVRVVEEIEVLDLDPAAGRRESAERNPQQ